MFPKLIRPAAACALALTVLAVCLGRACPPPLAGRPRAEPAGPAIVAAPADPAVVDNRLRAMEANVQALRAEVEAIREGW